MPKIKTNRGAAKRFRKTGKGKVKRSRAFGSHILTKKAPKRKRGLRGTVMMDQTDKKLIKRLMPND